MIINLGELESQRYHFEYLLLSAFVWAKGFGVLDGIMMVFFAMLYRLFQLVEILP